ncbi:PucR family transcriptional regulator [Prauserella cavernicola]|uniref:Helix-turn-helix domain-containing protein n=1 Tax=Prauserella cavernicola TaxID=2800127 RepID=A0A934QR87_9PSEU|nr:PucR family transcriptional regulator [Prauserella cavernicola]MBK1784905.1 helix-turn-helix domain-containing protein [Prauserella cavernicola]
MTVGRSNNGIGLRSLLVAIGLPLVELRTDHTDPVVRGVAILDPDDEPGSYQGELVLIIGVRGREAARSVRAAARRGASAVAVKEAPDELAGVAAEAGVALLGVAAAVRWDQLETVVRQVLDSATLAEGFTDEPGDLFSLAQTLATLTGGSVSIEDAGNRVLAYSRSDSDAAEVDELRRLSILGWQGPESYLALLREWGVFERLRAGEEVVRIEQHPELGIRRRLAVGIRAGTHHLGTVWVQQGREPFTDRAESALLGGARLAAVHLLRQRSDQGRSREELVTGLLTGHTSPDLVAGQLGLDPAAPAVVVAFTARESTPDEPVRELRLAEMLTMVSVHMASFRRAALVGTDGSRVYAVLPEARQLTGLAPELADVAEVLTRRTGVRVQAGIGSAVASLREVGASRAEADRVLDAMGTARSVASIADLRAEVLLSQTLSLLEANPDLRDPAVGALSAHDAEHGSELVPTLLAWLDAMGDVRAVASALHVHPNTVRHRVRRASEVSGVDLADPRERLSCHLQLLLAVTTGVTSSGVRG